MDLLFVLALAALFATIVMLVRGIIFMSRGGDADFEASTRLMFRRVEFQAAAVALVLAAGLFAGGWLRNSAPPPSDARLAVELGVMPAEVIRHRYGPQSAEAMAYGGVSSAADDAYLVTVALTERNSGQRIDDARVTATVGALGLSGASEALQPAAFASALTYGNYFRMPKPGAYRIDLAVERPGLDGRDLIRLVYHRE